MIMKTFLLLSAALIATPAFAQDAAPAPTSNETIKPQPASAIPGLPK